MFSDPKIISIKRRSDGEAAMSIKIYEAYRTKPGVDIWEFMKQAKKEAMNNATEILRELYERIQTTPSLANNVREKFQISPDAPLSNWNISDFVYDRYNESRLKKQPTAYNFDTSFTVRKHKDHFYIIPYENSGTRNIFSFFKTHPDLEEYGYWNNTDEPEGMSEKEWKEREENWAVLLDDWDNYVSVDVCSFDNFFYFDPCQ